MFTMSKEFMKTSGFNTVYSGKRDLFVLHVGVNL